MTRIMSNISLSLVFMMASLPFYSVLKGPGGLSITFVFIAIIIIQSLFEIISNKKINYQFGIFDYLLIFYIFSCILSSILKEQNVFVLMKTSVYVMSFYFFGNYLKSLDESVVKKSIVVGCTLGIMSFSMFFIYIVTSKGMWPNLISDFSYWGFTYNFFNELNSFFSLRTNDFDSSQIMRNTLGEVFALYLGIFLILSFRQKNALINTVLSFVFVIFCFSRRAFIDSIFIIFTYAKNKLGVGFLYVVMVVFFLTLPLVIVFVPSDLNVRLFDLTDQSRLEQYELAIDIFSRDFFLGNGYGEKLLGEKYVHNFVLASFFMNGILGLISSLALYSYLIFSYIKNSNGYLTSLLIIPLIGLTIGSTVEGVFTISGWIVIMLLKCYKRSRF